MVKIEEKIMSALVDSGATQTVISKETANELRKKGIKFDMAEVDFQIAHNFNFHT